jgi:hypothetical protein
LLFFKKIVLNISKNICIFKMVYPGAVAASRVSGSTSKYLCPHGTGLGHVYLRNSTFLNNTIVPICDVAFYRENDIDLGLAIGLSLGIGIPVIVFILWIFAVQHRLWCYSPNYDDSSSSCSWFYRSPTPRSSRSSTEELEYDAKLTVMSHLSTGLYAEFIQGNLNIELKKDLQRIRDHNNEVTMKKFVQHAKKFKHNAMANWIKNLKFTTLQDEGIV